MRIFKFPLHCPTARRLAILRRLFVASMAIPILSLCLVHPAVAQDKKLRIGLTVPTLVNPFFVGMDRGVREECQKLGYELIAPNANNDMATQANQMEDLITKKVDLIIICPINAEAIVPVVKKANAAKIPVVALDRGSAGGEMASFIETNNVEMGQKGADFLADIQESLSREVTETTKKNRYRAKRVSVTIFYHEAARKAKSKKGAAKKRRNFRRDG